LQADEDIRRQATAEGALQEPLEQQRRTELLIPNSETRHRYFVAPVELPSGPPAGASPTASGSAAVSEQCTQAVDEALHALLRDALALPPAGDAFDHLSLDQLPFFDEMLESSNRRTSQALSAKDVSANKATDTNHISSPLPTNAASDTTNALAQSSATFQAFSEAVLCATLHALCAEAATHAPSFDIEQKQLPRAFVQRNPTDDRSSSSTHR
jgi:hypothetical protein